MLTCQTLEHLLAARKQLQGVVALVPTMGNLHQGHLKLVKRAKQVADSVIVTIYVNPLQFGANEDLDNYPRTLEQDLEQLKALDVDLVFTPDDAVIYPDGLSSHTQVQVPELGERLCGASRPGHFHGVTTVVNKLFNLCQPNIALFGQKDFQQLSIIKKMVTDLAMPIEIIGVETEREASGLAMSSRNGYLTAEQKQQAALFYQTLESIKQQILAGERDYPKLLEQAQATLSKNNFKIDYLEICDQRTLQVAKATDKHIVVLAAAWLGSPRLIDNLLIDID